MKEVYEGEINDQLQDEQVLAKRIEKTSEGVFETPGGKYVTFPLRTQRNHGISYRAESGALASAGKQGYAATQETLRYGYGRINLTGPVMKMSDSKPKAFATALDSEMSGLKSDLARDENRIWWGYSDPNGVVSTGVTGIISKVTADGTASTTVTAPTYAVIEVGMVIDIVNSAGTAIASGTGLTVVTADAFATSFTVDAAVTTVAATGHYIVRTGNYNKEPHGLLGLVDDIGSYHNINSATAGNEYWRSYQDSTTTTLTEPAMIALCDQIRRRGGSRPSAIFCSLGVRRAYFSLMTSLRRYNEPKEFAGGLVGLAFNYGKEIPVVEDLDAPASTMLFLDEKEIRAYQTHDWKWDDFDGNVFKYIAGYDVWDAFMSKYWQIVTHKRNAHGKMTAITEG
jgi:hypothetical protein